MLPAFRLVVLVSGEAVALQAVLDACASGELHARVAAVISDRPEAYGLERARRARVQAIAKVKPRWQERREFDAELAELIASHHPDWVVLDDWAPEPTPSLTAPFPDRVIRLFPALPGAFPGPHPIERAYYAYCRGEIDRTGVTVYRVPAAEAEPPGVLGSEPVPIAADDTVETLEERIREVKGQLLVGVLQTLTLSARIDGGQRG